MKTEVEISNLVDPFSPHMSRPRVANGGDKVWECKPAANESTLKQSQMAGIRWPSR